MIGIASDIKVKVIEESSFENFSDRINHWCEIRKNVVVLEMQYQTLQAQGSYSKSYSVMIIYKEGESS